MMHHTTTELSRPTSMHNHNVISTLTLKYANLTSGEFKAFYRIIIWR